MAEVAPLGIVDGLRELVQEFRGVSDMLGEVVERTVRLETKVDRLVEDVSHAAGMQIRLTQLESWVKAELEARAARGVARALWVAAAATLAGGSVGAVAGHFWR